MPFYTHVKKLLFYLIVLHFRSKQVDLVQYFSTRLVDDFASHIRLYRRSLERVMEHSKDGMLTDHFLSHYEIEQLSFD